MRDYTIRPATVSDAAVVAAHRVGMFRDMGLVTSEGLAADLRAASADALVELLRTGAYVGWLAVDAAGRVVAGSGAHVKPQLPRVSGDGTRVVTEAVPLVVNVYTEPDWRRRGVARALMRTLLRWAREQGFDRVLLHASEDGRPLYQSLGFTPTNEMRWSPSSEDSGG